MAPSDPVSAPCQPGPTPAHHGGIRRAEIRWIVIHSTEGGTARSVATYFAQTDRAASAHLVVDDHECLRLLADAVVAYHAPPLNEESIGVEIVGYARWGRLRWLASRQRLRRAAWRVASLCRRHHIPPRWVDASGLVSGEPGITTHAEVSRAWHRSTHWDPGPGFPRRRFMRYVRAALTLRC